MENEKVQKKKGFAAMDPKLVSEIARKGGKAAHVAGTAHKFTRDEAIAAGRKGGASSQAKKLAERTKEKTDETPA